MSKISAEQKAAYNEAAKPIKEEIEQISKEIRKLEREAAKGGPLTNYIKLGIVKLILKQIALYLRLSKLSLEIMGIKNEPMLEKARKLCYQYLQVIESFAGNIIDTSLTENEEVMKTISKLDDRKRLYLIKNIIECIEMVEEKFGASSKWKWSFVDLYARAVTAGKNLIDFRKIQKEMDPRIEGFPERTELINFIKDAIKRAAEKLREKYELATFDPAEMKKAISFLQLLARINTFFGTQEEVDTTRKMIKVWEEKLKEDEKKLEEKQKKKSKK